MIQSKELLINKNQKLLYAWFSAMFTRVDLVMMTDNSSTDLLKIAEEISSIIIKTENTGNKFDEASELAHVNHSAYDFPQQISTELFQMLMDCAQYHHDSYGHFDITVNSKNGFTQGMLNLVFNKQSQTIKFSHPVVQLDLSGFIKGYVLNDIKVYLNKKGIENALVNLGNSSILAMGNHPNGKGWKISLTENPMEDIELYNECLTTSGNKEQTKWPVRNPKTGKELAAGKLISVKTEDPAHGEVLTKALFMATENEKQVLLKHFNATIVYSNK